MSLDFTLEKYTTLCQTLKKIPAEMMTLSQFIKAGQPQRAIVILRHDIDRSLASALRMARLEASFNISSTYYFRTTRTVFQPDAMESISNLGHEIGYHYEVLSKARGNYQRAIEMFEQELSRFQRIIPVETISMHGSPLLPWDNRDLWKKYDFGDYGLLGEAYLSIDYTNVYYFTDTGRSWHAGRYNVRDWVNSRRPSERIYTTDALINFLQQTPKYPILINTHPNRWATNRLSWTVSLMSDWAINQTKRLAISAQSTWMKSGVSG